MTYQFSDDVLERNPELQDMLPKPSETVFQNDVIIYAHSTGWFVSHFRGVRIQRQDGSVYYQTPCSADGKGLPDLLMVRE
jgi:hypothetical protein